MKRLLITLVLLCSLSPQVQGADLSFAGNGSMAMRMMNAMWDMMEWFVEQRRPGYRSIPWNYVYPGSPWTYRYPASPWDRRAHDPWRQGGTAFANAPLWGTLDGVWRATSGEYWIVQGNQFALYAGRDRYLHGNISVQGDHILAIIPATGMTFDYRYWLVEGMLLVRDEFGNAMVLDLVQPTARNWSW